MSSPSTGSNAIDSTATGNPLIDALLAGVQWESSTITYSFPTIRSYWSSNYDYSSEPWTAGYGELFASNKTSVQAALSTWSNVSNIHFTLVAETLFNVGDLRFAFGTLSSDAQAWAYYPGTAPEAGDVWFNSTYSSYYNKWTPGSYEYSTAIHEIGHALGLKHPFDGSEPTTTVLPAELDTISYSIMSYSAWTGDTGSRFTYTPTTPMVLDIAAIQALYGANTSFNAANTTYTFSQSASYHMTIWDAGGTDTIVYSSTTGGLIDLRPGITGGSNLGKQIYAIDSNYVSHAIANIWIAYETLIENATGGSGNDILNGNDAANMLIGGGGIDSFAGGAGNDTYVIDNIAEAGNIVENADEGIDTLIAKCSGTNVTLDFSSVNNLENIQIAGTGIFTLTGNSCDNTLQGNASSTILFGAGGNDTLDGMAGADTMYGGAGDDVYLIDNKGDQVIEYGNEGEDCVRVNLAAIYTLGDHIENAIATGKNATGLVGNGLDNLLTGNAAANRLDGGLGNDTMAGEKGNDTYVVSAGDTIRETSTLLSEIDTVLSSISWSLGDNLENLVLQGSDNLSATGNSLKNSITGNSGNNAIDGGVGIDKLIGGLGDDTYIVDLSSTNRLEDTVTEALNAGRDTLIVRGGNGALTTFSTLTLGANIEVFDASATGSTLLNLTGNGLANQLIGNAANNTLNGGAGNDTLIGGNGSDALTGGTGADFFVFNVAPSPGAPDLIKDFTSKLDTIQLDGDIFAAISRGVLSSDNFAMGSSAGDANDFVIYNAGNGMLYYDSDGNGTSAAAVEIVQLGSTTHPALLASDILIA